DFPDYTAGEIYHIFLNFVRSEDYQLEDEPAVRERVIAFIQTIASLGCKNAGNGRLARKLFRSATTYMAERDSQDMTTLTLQDVAKAAEEIEAAERLVSAKQKREVGFRMA
ncbi:MAG: hypothetical protein ACM3ZQ_06895, partial [Bacillota bacterium]